MALFTSLAEKAKLASRTLALTDAEQRSRALRRQAEISEGEFETVLAANREDCAAARAAGLDAVRLGIMRLSENDRVSLSDTMSRIAERKDLLGQCICENQIADDLHLTRCMVPIGVVALLFEARPSVAWESFALCLRNADVLILRPSRYIARTMEALTAIFRKRLRESGLTEDAVLLASGGSYADSYELFRMERFVDVGIVRGGYETLEAMKREATVPLAVCGPGNCHVYIDDSADYGMAERILINSKAERPLACNATETLLVHEAWAERYLARLLAALRERGIRFVGDEKAQRYGVAELAEEKDWAREFFAPCLAVGIVADLTEAIEHINRYRTPHTECILTETEENAQRFFREVEANALAHNASSRLIDGGVFGFGSEVGISTGKLPWGGPIAARQLVQEKFFLRGHGNIR